MNQIYENYKNQGFELIGLSTEGEIESVRAFSKKVEIKYPIYVAETDLLDEYAIQYIPYKVFIDKKGVKRYEEVGFSEASKVAFEERIKTLLKE